MSNDLIIPQNGAMIAQPQNDFLTPVQSIDQALAQRSIIIEFTRRIMKKDVDYGIIPGTKKASLWQPGAQKLAQHFGLRPVFTILEEVKDWTGADHGGEPFFSFTVKCDVYRHGEIMGSCIGNCNSFEKKYRYRDVNEKFASDEDKARGKKVVKTGEYGKYTVYKVPSDDIFDQVNTALKMSQKRSLVGAVINATSASEFYTQDVEDHAEDSSGSTDASKPVKSAAVQTAKPAEAKAESISSEPDNRPAMPGVLNSLRQVYAKRGETPPADMESWTQEFAKNQLMSLSAKGGN